MNVCNIQIINKYIETCLIVNSCNLVYISDLDVFYEKVSIFQKGSNHFQVTVISHCSLTIDTNLESHTLIDI